MVCVNSNIASIGYRYVLSVQLETLSTLSQYATSNLEVQIGLLEAFIASVDVTISGEPTPNSATISPDSLKNYMEIKRNVVSTIRQVVEVVGRYAGGTLPESAKQQVKNHILSLPARWSVAVKDAGLGEGWTSADSESHSASAASSSKAPNSPNPRKRGRLESASVSLSKSVETVHPGEGVNAASTSGTSLAPPSASGSKRNLLPPTANAARNAATRVLTLARESLLSVKNVTAVFQDTINKTET